MVDPGAVRFELLDRQVVDVACPEMQQVGEEPEVRQAETAEISGVSFGGSEAAFSATSTLSGSSA